MLEDTIAAIATPAGQGGIAIIRVSGGQAIEKVEAVFKPRKKGRRLRDVKGYHMILGWIVDDRGQLIDECLLAVMRRPHSYTAEDTVEVHCHGGMLAAQQCLRRVLSQQIRPARPGEFTQRAYINGRLDISQAEAVIEIIRAKSQKALYLAAKQLAGCNSQHMRRLKEQMVRVVAMVEASMDFPEEVGEPGYDEIQGLLEEAQADIKRLLAAGQRAEIYRSGVKVVICGKPNVGKSSWLNRMSGWERAIVTEIPGTTRDIIEEYISVKGIPVRLIDTAGIRRTEDRVESMGVQIARQAINEAALAIFILDITSGITSEDQEVFSSLDPARTIILVNKDDLPDKRITPERLEAGFPGIPAIYGSVKEEQGLEELEDIIEKMILAGQADQDDLEMLLGARQQEVLKECLKQIQAVRDILGRAPLDCLAVEIGMVLDSLGEITGENLQDAVIDRIFRDFCIGK